MKSQSQRAAADGFMTMWSDSTTTIVGGSCEYANAANGGLGSPAASSPYIASEGYCAVDSTLYSSGGACGSCWRVSYDGSPATDPGVPGSMVVQVVDSGSAKTFDCHLTAFQRITGASTGVFPITYEPVDCDVGSGGPVATVLDGDNAWYTKVIFSNMVSAVVKADLFLGENAFTMSRVSGATWSASTAGKRDAASFSVTLDTGDIIAFRCFDSWPVPTGSSCTGVRRRGVFWKPLRDLDPLGRFVPVDGGSDRACRGATPADNSAAYYRVVGSIRSLEQCQSQCRQTEGCQGVEYSRGRCEVWTRPEGIQASIALSGGSEKGSQEKAPNC
ncbi:EXPA12 [Symbiodinium sp. CCMP2456]|nr:EXPA12 [Symbiodinium sp. CCMP2456]